MGSNRGTRWQSSVTTFGPVGRIAVTVAVLVPVYWYLQLGIFGMVGAVVWIGWVLPRALRDTWRRAELPQTDLTRLRDQTAREAAAPRPDAPTDWDPPKRW